MIPNMDEASRRRREVVEAALPALLDEEQLTRATALWMVEFDHKPGFPFAAFAHRLTEVVPGVPDLPELLGALAQATRAAAEEIVRSGTPRGVPLPSPSPDGTATATDGELARPPALVGRPQPENSPAPTGIPQPMQRLRPLDALRAMDSPRPVQRQQPQNTPQSAQRQRPKVKVDVRKVLDPAPGTGTQVDDSDENTVFNAVLEALVSRVDPDDRKELREHLEKTVSQCEVSADVLLALRAWSVSVDSQLAIVDVPMTRAEMRAVVHHLYIWCCDLEGARATDAIFNDAMNEVSRQPAARTLDPRDLL